MRWEKAKGPCITFSAGGEKDEVSLTFLIGSLAKTPFIKAGSIDN